MFIALFLSTVFTLVYGTAAARLRRAEKVLVPILDVLQSIPILVFLPVALTFFIKLFPNNLLGLELASIFVIFTSQAWNMTFSFYHSLISQPTELDEAARMYRLTKWQRFWKLDVPSSMIGLVWNMMMSMGGGWFFLTASEAVTVFIEGKGLTESLPGIGSYMAAAVSRGLLHQGRHRHRHHDHPRRRDELLRLPARWSRGRSASASRPRRRRRSPRASCSTCCGARRSPTRWASADAADRPPPRPDHPALRPGRVPPARGRSASGAGGDFIFWGVIVARRGLRGRSTRVVYLNAHLGFSRFPGIVAMGFATFGRVVVLLVVVSTVIWVPIGVKIGMRPEVCHATPSRSSRSSPASRPSFSSPSSRWSSSISSVPLDIGAILLMALGAQWYILFNVIAGCQRHPERHGRDDVRDAPDPAPALAPGDPAGHLPGLRDRRRSRQPGGAWNASIVAELVAWHHQTLNAYGLGNYISTASSHGKFALLIAGRHRDERVRGHGEPSVLAAPVPAGRDQVLAVRTRSPVDGIDRGRRFVAE